MKLSVSSWIMLFIMLCAVYNAITAPPRIDRFVPEPEEEIEISESVKAVAYDNWTTFRAYLVAIFKTNMENDSSYDVIYYPNERKKVIDCVTDNIIASMKAKGLKPSGAWADIDSNLKACLHQIGYFEASHDSWEQLYQIELDKKKINVYENFKDILTRDEMQIFAECQTKNMIKMMKRGTCRKPIKRWKYCIHSDWKHYEHEKRCLNLARKTGLARRKQNEK